MSHEAPWKNYDYKTLDHLSDGSPGGMVNCDLVDYQIIFVAAWVYYWSFTKPYQLLPLQAGKLRKHVSEQEKPEEGLGPNIKSIVTMLMLMLLMMFAVHCTWVTSNAYSSPSVVLASYNHDG